MSLIQDVTDAVNELGRVTIDDLSPLFPSHSRKQVHRALHQARFERRIRIVERGETGGRHGGGEPFVYGPLSDEPIETPDDKPLPTRTCIRGEYGIPRVASVWDLGASA